MKLFLFLCTVLSALIAYRVYHMMQRKLPKGLENKKQLRWLDELGRLGNMFENGLEKIGIDPTIGPIKTLVDKAFSLILNPTPWKTRFENVKVTYDTYAGVPVIVYTPSSEKPSKPAAGPLPVFLYFHGGGWTWFSAGSFDIPMKNLANKTNFMVITPDYRTAPQHLFPAAYDDCLAVTKYVIKNTKKLKIRKDLIIVAGDGSGGNLAAAVARKVKSKITMQLLINPALQILNFQTPSYKDNAKKLPGLTSPAKEVTHWLRYVTGNVSPKYKRDMLKNYHASPNLHEQYSDFLDSSKRIPNFLNITNSTTSAYRATMYKTAEEIDRFVADDRLSPMIADNIEGVPNAYFITSQVDVLRDEAIMYAHRLLDSQKVKVKWRHYKSFHGFFLFAGNGFWKFPASDKAVDELVDFIKFQFMDISQE